MPLENEINNNPRVSISKIIIIGGLLLTAVSLVFVVLTFWPALSSEISYFIKKPDKNIPVELKSEVKDAGLGANKTNSQEVKPIIPVDENFGIVIPKIAANARIVADVDPNNSKEYQKKLTLGVAHAKGSPYPNQPGNTFLFAHSSDSFINANIYNSVFYLLNKITVDDEFYILYRGQKLKFIVKEVSVVNPDQMQYFSGTKTSESGKDGKEAVKTVTLMTCWPAGTTFKRLVVIGELGK